MSSARFKIRNVTAGGPWSLFDDAGFDADPGDEIEVQLEDTPALDINQTVFTCTARSSGRTVPTFSPASGEAATPTSAVTILFPIGERGTWAITCMTNGGVIVYDALGRPDPTVNVKTRYIAVRTANLALRHPLDGERSEYEPGAGYAVSLQEMMDVLDLGVGGTVPATRMINTVDGLYGGGSLAADLTLGLTGINDTQHGARGGGALHAVATGAVAGFMSGSDKAKLDAVPAAASIATTTYVGDAITAALSDPILVRGASTSLPAGVPVGALTTQLVVENASAAAIVPMRVNRSGAVGSVLDVLELGRTLTAGVGDIGTGLQTAWHLPDGTGGNAVGASHRVELTSVDGVDFLAKHVWAVRVANSVDDALTLSPDGLSVVNDLIVGGDLTVSGTTTTVNSTAVSLADRLVVFNSSTGIVPAPTQIAGVAIDRGSADGVTKRDAPGMFWDEANARFAVAYNTALDQTTLGTHVPIKASSFVGPTLENPGGTLTLSGSSLAVGMNAVFSGTLVERQFGLGTSISPGVSAECGSAATVGTPVQHGGVLLSLGFAWDTDNSVSRAVRAGWYVEPVSAATVGYRVRLAADAGTGTLANTGLYYASSLPVVGGPGLVSETFAAADGDGFVLLYAGEYKGQVLWDGSQLAISADSGSGPILLSGSETTITGATKTPRVVAAPSTPTSSSNAVTFNLMTSQNVEHSISENTTVSITGGDVGQRGVLVFTQDGTGRTITMPSASSTIIYSETLAALGVTGMVSTTAGLRTIMHYYIMTGGKILIHGREVLAN